MSKTIEHGTEILLTLAVAAVISIPAQYFYKSHYVNPVALQLYESVEWQVEKDPTMQPVADEILADGVLSRNEYDAFMKIVHDRERQRIVDKLVK